jgi:integrative and conjugative element protein (TIGR02256 family)
MIAWFKKHPEYLSSECRELSCDSNYEQLYLERNNLLVSHGKFVIRFNEIHKFYFLIVYPDSFPYSLPLFFPLKGELTKEQVIKISESAFQNVRLIINDKIKYYYQLRHQNSTGNLCVLEWDNLDSGFDFYGVKTILKRVKEWCKGTITGNFPEDSQEVEFYSHFKVVERHLSFFYPETFLNSRLLQGEAYAKLFATVPASRFDNEASKNFIGCLLTGTNESGFYEGTEKNFPEIFTSNGIKNEIQLEQKPGIVNNLIEEGRLMKMFWFNLNEEPAPFESFKDLISVVGDGDYEYGKKRMSAVCVSDLKLLPEFFFVAIRFPNRKAQSEFQLFRIRKGSAITSVLIGNTPPEESFESIVGGYSGVSAIPTSKFTDDSFHERNKGRANRDILKSKVLNLVGVGAIGSEIADIMAKAGVGKLLLLNNQKLKIDNSVRHLCGIDYTGVPKISAVANSVVLHNPFTEVLEIPFDLTTIDINDYFQETSVSISTIAEDNTEDFLNEQAVISNKTVYYVRALRAGKVARIFRVIPGEDACFHCLELYRKEGKLFKSIPEDKEMPTLRNECNNPIRPASAADLKLIASLASRIILDELQNNESSKINHWIWSTEKLGTLKPFQLYSHHLPPHDHCVYCNSADKAKVYIPKIVLEKMKSLVESDPTVETGGVLAGYWNESSDLHITDASGPGPRATRTATRFEKDIVYCQQFLDEILKTNQNLVYIGEWHSHPTKNNRPSNTDLKSLEEISFQKEYLTDKPVMIILSDKGEPSCTIHPAGKRYYFPDFKIFT